MWWLDITVSEDFAACFFRVEVCELNVMWTYIHTVQRNNPVNYDSCFHLQENLKYRIEFGS